MSEYATEIQVQSIRNGKSETWMGLPEGHPCSVRTDRKHNSKKKRMAQYAWRMKLTVPRCAYSMEEDVEVEHPLWVFPCEALFIDLNKTWLSECCELWPIRLLKGNKGRVVEIG